MKHTKHVKAFWELTIAERIQLAGWWKGTEREWQALTMPEREAIAFAATGCRVAYPTWEAPVDCCHVECRIARGEQPKIALTNAVLRGEAESGWLRFTKQEDRKRLAKIFRAYRKAARETGVYDPWKIGWQGMVFPAIT
jgi:hypothetical protein